MNTKDIKKYSLINETLNAHADDKSIVDKITALASIDFTTAFEVWEYILTAHQKRLEEEIVSVNLERKIFAVLNDLSESSFRRLFTESLPLNKLIYSICATSCTGTNLQFIANLILSAKLDAAEEALRCVKANFVEGYGERMKSIVDTVFYTYCTKNNVRKCELTRKQSTLLLEYVTKIKGPNKTLLGQRIKEL